MEEVVVATRNQPQPARKQLVHPVYLDPEILISFLATLEDGVYFSSEVAEKAGRNSASKGEASGEAKLPGLASLLGLTLSASGKYSRDSANTEDVESKFVRQHTAASLFNNLRTRMLADDFIIDLDTAPDLSGVRPGDIVELSGEFTESPIKKIIDLMEMLKPFMNQQADAARAAIPGSKARQKLTPQERQVVDAAKQAIEAQLSSQEENWAMLDLVKSDLEQSPVVDLVLEAPKSSALVTANRDLLSADVTAALMGGTFKLLGKVSAVDPRVDAETLVVRRGAVGIMAESAILPMIDNMNEQFTKNDAVNFTLPSGKVAGPYLQVIPLAIFV